MLTALLAEEYGLSLDDMIIADQDFADDIALMDEIYEMSNPCSMQLSQPFKNVTRAKPRACKQT